MQFANALSVARAIRAEHEVSTEVCGPVHACYVRAACDPQTARGLEAEYGCRIVGTQTPRRANPSRNPSEIAELLVRAKLDRLRKQFGHVDGFDAIVAEARPRMVARYTEQIKAVLATLPGASPADAGAVRAQEDLRKAGERWSANLRAMQLVGRGTKLTPSERAEVLRYSGMGGLGGYMYDTDDEGAYVRTSENELVVKPEVRDAIPDGFPTPELRGLIHEYYTPTPIAHEIGRVLAPAMQGLARVNGQSRLRALEPSAGVGRFIGATWGVDMAWDAVEYSAVSGRILQAAFPSVEVHLSSFEEQIERTDGEWAGAFELVVGNPPYGQRGSARLKDASLRSIKTDNTSYFLYRTANLVAPGGFAAWVVPMGIASGTSKRRRELRAFLMSRFYLVGAWRLPMDVFPGAQVVTDVLIFRSRGAVADEQEIRSRPVDGQFLDGTTFDEHPERVLGEVIDKGTGRWSYMVKGEFRGLSELFPDALTLPIGPQKPRPLLPGSEPGAMAYGESAAKKLAKRAARRRKTRKPVKLSPEIERAASLGHRLRKYQAVLVSDVQAARDAHAELVADLRDWSSAYGAPGKNVELKSLAKADDSVSVRTFLQAFTADGELKPSIVRQPTVDVEINADPNAYAAVADALWKANGRVEIDRLKAAVEQLGGRWNKAAVLSELVEAGWFVHDGGRRATPGSDYLTGELWPKYDEAVEAGRNGEPWGSEQARRIIDAIEPTTYEVIDNITLRQSWIPDTVIDGWVGHTFPVLRDADLRRKNGEWTMRKFPGVEQHADIRVTAAEFWKAKQEDDKDFRRDRGGAGRFLGYLLKDNSMFRLAGAREQTREQKLEASLREIDQWNELFNKYLDRRPTEQEKVAEAYNRTFRGYAPPTFSTAPVTVARWGDVITPRPHQAEGARRMVEQRGGLLAYDVGVGKTITSILAVGKLREQGLARRPVILIPKTIALKWRREIILCMPDYRVGIIGVQLTVKRVKLANGNTKEELRTRTDTPAERTAKWEAFQRGEYDVVLLTYPALGRTTVSAPAVREYAAQHRELAIARKLARQKGIVQGDKKLTPRDQAILAEKSEGHVAEILTLPPSQKPDQIDWDAIGVDFLLVDEAHNFKNLYGPSAEPGGGTPKYMGSVDEGSKRAWHLDIRCALVRKRAGGRGVGLLTATPAKNSPVEFYTLLRYIDADAWTRAGINSPDDFVDRYIRLEMVLAPGSDFAFKLQLAAVGFLNVPELRAIIMRYASWKTALGVGLDLPETPPPVLEHVELDQGSEVLFSMYKSAIRTALKRASYDESAKFVALGLLMRMQMAGIHPALAGTKLLPEEGPLRELLESAPEGGKYREWEQWAQDRPIHDLESSKIDLLGEKIQDSRGPVGTDPDWTCGHIIFADSVRAHAIVKTYLERKYKSLKGRIAVMNADTAKKADKRAAMADEFNGDLEAGVAPKYDVLIANQVAYEGIDLQTRTCGVHHLDLPWEPATLQQRNGRAVRQGNIADSVVIRYYLLKKSADGLRLSMVDKKSGWLQDFLEGTADAELGNPLAEETDDSVIFMMIADTEEEARALAERAKARQEARRAKKQKESANRLALQIVAYASKARAIDEDDERRPVMVRRYEQALRDARALPPELMPWIGVLETALSTPTVKASSNGDAPPVQDGLVVSVNGDRNELVMLGPPNWWSQTAHMLRVIGPPGHRKAFIVEAKAGEDWGGDYTPTDATFPLDEWLADYRGGVEVGALPGPARRAFGVQLVRKRMETVGKYRFQPPVNDYSVPSYMADAIPGIIGGEIVPVVGLRDGKVVVGRDERRASEWSYMEASKVEIPPPTRAGFVQACDAAKGTKWKVTTLSKMFAKLWPYRPPTGVQKHGASAIRGHATVEVKG